MDTGTAIIGVGVLISLFGYLEIIRRDLRSEIKDMRDEIKDVRKASENAHNDILTRLGNVETQLASLTERVNCIDDKLDLLQHWPTVDPKA